MLGLELLPLRLAGLESSLLGGVLALLGAGQYRGVDLSGNGSAGSDAGAGEVGFSLGQAGGSGLVARRVRRHGFEGFTLLTDSLELRLHLGEALLHDLLYRSLLGVGQVQAAQFHEAATMVAVTAEIAALSTRTGKCQRGAAKGRSQDDRQGHSLTHIKLLLVGGLLVTIGKQGRV
jgi:hypothetical protein